ncbi:MAG TPA: hypothetical protein VJ385_12050 [Fibrobacteria bacterium]|nr:hypothetical protein [Fibrobacteria bacterium]
MSFRAFLSLFLIPLLIFPACGRNPREGLASPGSGSGRLTGLLFPGNGVAGGDIGLDWTGPNLPSRTDHTALWEWTGGDQNGFFAVAWHCSKDGTWHGWSQKADTYMYDFGTHPYPYPVKDGLDPDGNAEWQGHGKLLNEQYFEIAGLIAPGRDFLASPGPGATYRYIPGRTYRQARVCRILSDGPDKGKLEHLYYIDLPDTTKVIRQIIPNELQAPANPVFRFGASPWTGDGNTNAETTNGILRALKIFRALPTADILAESAEDRKNIAVTANPPWYINVNPTPADVSDKSGAGHHPVWANSNRPKLYEE